jgi:tripartite-type tricarboxylate transporter receptor subunit TctC
MKGSRRSFVHAMTSAAALAVVPRVARAQAYPSRPVRIVVGFTAGGLNDIVARLVGQSLSERYGQPFVVENRVGAGGNIATELVVNAPADGHTLLLIGSSNTINPTLYEKLSFDFRRDIVPAASLIRVPLVMVVHPSFPARTVGEFIAYARANPGRVNMASGGNGGSPHLTGELFKLLAGVDMQHVPYRGSAPALADLIGGRVEVMFDNLPSAIEQIRSGQLRALAVTTAARSAALPDVPAIGESVPGYEASGIAGIGAPRGTSAAIVDQLNRDINAFLATAATQARLADMGGAALAGSPADFAALLSAEIEKWGRVIRAGKIKAE